jgi:uncharacterized membrane protein YfcA
MSLEPWQWAVAALAAFLIGLSKTGITGIAIFAVVTFASVLPARESVGVVLPVLLAGDLVAVTVYRREADRGQLLRLFPWAAAGVVGGAVAAGRLPDGAMRLLIGAIVVALALFQAARMWRPPADAGAPLPGWASPAAGLLSGFTTMVANAAGPLMTVYLLASGLPKYVFVGTAAWFFLALNLFKVPFSLGLGLITGSTLAVSLGLAPFCVAGALVGRRLIRGIDQRAFELIALALSLVAGLRLLLW